MKVAISIPDPLFEAAEKLAKAHALPRNKLYSEALSYYVSTHNTDEITARLNQVYSHNESDIEPELMSVQFEVLNHEAW
ncbi:MAG: ChpI protein [Pseudomonadota bacterium]